MSREGNAHTETDEGRERRQVSPMKGGKREVTRKQRRERESIGVTRGGELLDAKNLHKETRKANTGNVIVSRGSHKK